MSANSKVCLFVAGNQVLCDFTHIVWDCFKCCLGLKQNKAKQKHLVLSGDAYNQKSFSRPNEHIGMPAYGSGLSRHSPS